MIGTRFMSNSAVIHRVYPSCSCMVARVVDKLRRIPSTIVHRRYDIICPVKSACDLAAVWPEADFHIVLAGHAASEPAIVDVLVQATDRLADRYV
jgi:proline iminopeptidase